jgi:hypothetical protein
MAHINDTLRDLYQQLDGEQIPGGCPDCDAYQTMAPLEAMVWRMRVHHDDECPRWLKIQGKSGTA